MGRLDWPLLSFSSTLTLKRSVSKRKRMSRPLCRSTSNTSLLSLFLPRLDDDNNSGNSNNNNSSSNNSNSSGNNNSSSSGNNTTAAATTGTTTAAATTGTTTAAEATTTAAAAETTQQQRQQQEQQQQRQLQQHQGWEKENCLEKELKPGNGMGRFWGMPSWYYQPVRQNKIKNVRSRLGL